MSQLNKLMEQSFKSVVEAANSILILLPKEPTFDQVAAGLSLYLGLEGMPTQTGNKELIISCPTQMRVLFNRLVGVDRITDEIGSKNLVLSFLDYPAENIEKVSYDVENEQFKLTVVPKNQTEPPKKDQVHATYSGVSADTVVLVGGARPENFPPLLTDELAEAKLVHVGISDIQAPAGRNIISLARPASSISEVVAEYLKVFEGAINADIASNLLSGIHEGSENFNSKEVSATTFKLAGELMALGGKYTKKEEFKPMATNFGLPGMQMSSMPAGVLPAMPMPMPLRAMPNAAKLDDQNPEEETAEAPQMETVNPPKSWLKTPKIYKGTSVS